MDAAGSFVTQATTYQTTWHHNPENNLNPECGEKINVRAAPGGLYIQYSNLFQMTLSSVLGHIAVHMVLLKD